MKVFSLITSLGLVLSASAQLRPDTILDYARRGAVLTYNVDHSRCRVEMPPQIPAFSFGDVMQDVFVQLETQTEWTLRTASERPANSSVYNVTNGAIRVTEVALRSLGSEDAEAAVYISDVEEGAGGKVLATGMLTCTLASGGFAVYAQRPPGADLERETDVITSFRNGLEMSFSVDIGACTRSRSQSQHNRAAPNATEYWSARISDYRVPPTPVVLNSVEFTSVVTGARERVVLNGLVEEENKVTVKVYSEDRATHQPSEVVVFLCTLGTEGSFHVYRL